MSVRRRVAMLERLERERCGGLCRCGGQVNTEVVYAGEGWDADPAPGDRRVGRRSRVKPEPPPSVCPACGRERLQIVVSYVDRMTRDGDDAGSTQPSGPARSPVPNRTVRVPRPQRRLTQSGGYGRG